MTSDVRFTRPSHSGGKRVTDRTCSGWAGPAACYSNGAEGVQLHVPHCQCRVSVWQGKARLLRFYYDVAMDRPLSGLSRDEGEGVDTISDRDEAKAHRADSLPLRPISMLRHVCQSMPDSSAPDSVVLPVSQHESGRELLLLCGGASVNCCAEVVGLEHIRESFFRSLPLLPSERLFLMCLGA